MKLDLRRGDCLDVLPTLEAGSVHCCVTSPPYWGLRDYGVDGQLGLEATPEEFVAKMVEVFRAVWRVLRDDGTCWINLGDSYAGSSMGGGDQSTRCDGGKTQLRKQRDSQSHVKTPCVSGLKPKDLVGMPWRVALALQADGWYLRSDIIWCLSGGAKVYARTQKGESPMMIKDLVRLDPATVKLWNGETWTQCLGWNECIRPEDPIEIELRSGECIGSTPMHRWPTQRGNVHAYELKVGDTIQTTTLPEPTEIYEPGHIDGQVAWMLGIYLAEGSMDSKGRMQFAGHAKENAGRALRLSSIADGFGGTVRPYSDGNRGTIVVDCPALTAIVQQYIHGHSAKTKGLRLRAWRHRNRWLSVLFDGYLEGDGHEEEVRWRLGFTRNDRLAADIRTICARLGYCLTLKKSTSDAWGKTWPTYRGEVRMQRSGHRNEKSRSEIVSIGRSRARKFWDIGVEDDPHLFALASGVLTHNSKPNPMPESCTDRPTKSHEYLFLLTKSAKYFYDADAVREPHSVGSPTHPVSQYAASIDGPMYSSRRSESERGDARRFITQIRKYNPAGRNKRSVWTIATQSYVKAHFATFPEALVLPCILAGTSEEGCCAECGAPWERVVERTPQLLQATNNERSCDQNNRGDMPRANVITETTGWQPNCACNAETVPCTVLDPFLGSGTTAKVAQQYGRSFVGCELSAEYLELARDRFKQSRLFA